MNVCVEKMDGVSPEPEGALLPLQPPEAVHVVTLEDDHINEADCPDLTHAPGGDFVVSMSEGDGASDGDVALVSGASETLT